MQQIAAILQNKPRKATFKQKEFAKAYIKHRGNATKAALESYDTDYNNAKLIGHQNINKPAVIDEIENVRQSLVNKGITLDWLAQQAHTSIVSGIGVKATNKDANDMIKFMYKLNNAIPNNVKKQLTVNLKGNLSSESVDVVIKTLKTTQTKTNELIEDIS